jgi:drug/metabolite transporter (DMT)-like permease
MVFAGILLVTVMAAFIKVLAAELPLYEVVFIRSGISLVILAWLLWRQKIPFRPKNPRLVTLRSVIGFGGMTCYFFSLGHLSFGDANMLVNTYPVFVPVLSVFFLKERPSRELLVLIAASWLGILLVLRPQFVIFNAAGLTGLIGAMLTACDIVLINRSHLDEPALRLTFYYLLACTLLPVPFMLYDFVWPDVRQGLLFAAAGLCGTASQIFSTRGFGLGGVSFSSPLAYTGVVMAFLIGVLAWGEIPTAWSIAGSLVVIAGSLRISLLKEPITQLKGDEIV